MIKNMLRFTAAALVFMVAQAARADVLDSASMIYPFLDIAPGARAAAMADAVCGLSGDHGTAFSNPAGLAAVKKTQVSLTYGKWFADSSYQNISAATPFPFGTIGLQFIYVGLGSFEMRDEFGGLLNGTIDSYDMAVACSYAFKPAKNISTGISARMLGESAAGNMQGTAVFDVGAIYEMDKFSFGVSLDNLGAGLSYPLPFAVRAGASANLPLAKDQSVTAGFDMKYLNSDDLSISTGAEYSYNDILFVRAGYRLHFGDVAYDSLTGLTFGLGSQYRGVVLDYALVPYGDLGFTHRVSVSYSFGGAKTEKTEAKPEEKTAVKKAAPDKKMAELNRLYSEVAKNKKDPSAWEKLGFAYMDIGNKKYALTCFKEALKLSPGDDIFSAMVKKLEMETAVADPKAKPVKSSKKKNTGK